MRVHLADEEGVVATPRQRLTDDLLGGAVAVHLGGVDDPQPGVEAGADRVVSVRLLDKSTGKAVSDAVIFSTRLDMAPDGMQEMATKVTPMQSTEPGTYRFKATFGMAGRWQLSLGAKVQGETGSVESKLVVTAEQ